MTQGFVVKSVQAGRSPISPSLASSNVPEHCAPMSCRRGSSLMRESKAASAAYSRVLTPLPMMMASASAANSSGCWRWTVTPFMEVTSAVGAVM